jgi:hypothetical protein
MLASKPVTSLEVSLLWTEMKVGWNQPWMNWRRAPQGLQALVLLPLSGTRADPR